MFYFRFFEHLNKIRVIRNMRYYHHFMPIKICHKQNVLYSLVIRNPQTDWTKKWRAVDIKPRDLSIFELFYCARIIKTTQKYNTFLMQHLPNPYEAPYSTRLLIILRGRETMPKDVGMKQCVRYNQEHIQQYESFARPKLQSN